MFTCHPRPVLWNDRGSWIRMVAFHVWKHSRFTIHDSRFGVSKEAGEIHREWSRSRVGRIVCETRHAAVEPVVSFSDE